MDKVKVEGIEEAMKAIDMIAKDYPKSVITAGIRKAAKPFLNAEKMSVPVPEMKKLAGVRTYTRSKTPLVSIGMFGGRNKTIHRKKGDGYMSMWFIDYWLEYGTLANRDPAYRFGNARRSKSSSWKGGIQSMRAQERAWRATRSSVVAAIPTETRASADRYNKRMEAKLRRV